MSVILDPDEPDRHAIDGDTGALLTPVWFGPVGEPLEDLVAREPVGWIPEDHFSPDEPGQAKPGDGQEPG